MTRIIKPDRVEFCETAEGWVGDVLPDPERGLFVRDFDALEFSQVGRMYLNYFDALEYLPEFDGTLVSAEELLWHRFTTNGVTRPDDPYLTRTATLRFVNDGRVLVAVDDSPNLEENILLQKDRVKEGYEIQYVGKNWLVSSDDPVIAGAIRRATVSGRIYEAFESSAHALSLDGEFSSSVFVRALIPRTAEETAQYLRTLGFAAGYVYDMPASKSIDQGLTGDAVMVRGVILDGDSTIIADNELFCCGLALFAQEKTGVKNRGTRR